MLTVNVYIGVCAGLLRAQGGGGAGVGHGGQEDAAPQVQTPMLTYAHVCSRMLTYADVCWRMLAYAVVGGDKLDANGDGLVSEHELVC